MGKQLLMLSHDLYTVSVCLVASPQPCCDVHPLELCDSQKWCTVWSRLQCRAMQSDQSAIWSMRSLAILRYIHHPKPQMIHDGYICNLEPYSSCEALHRSKALDIEQPLTTSVSMEMHATKRLRTATACPKNGGFNAGWWFGTFYFFHILGMSSSQLTFIFFRGVGQPPTRMGFYQQTWWFLDGIWIYHVDKALINHPWLGMVYTT